MAIKIDGNHSIGNAVRSNKSGSSLQTNLERLSSGKRINSAKDDAARLAYQGDRLGRHRSKITRGGPLRREAIASGRFHQRDRPTRLRRLLQAATIAKHFAGRGATV